MRRLAPAAAAVAFALLAAAFVYAATSHPLSGVAEVRGAKGYPARIGWWLRNDANVRVTIKEIKPPFRGVEVRLRDEGSNLEPNEPFRPFMLGPGDSRFVVLFSRLPECKIRANEGTSSVVAQRVHYSVLGVPREDWVEFDDSATFGMGFSPTPNGGHCLVAPPPFPG
jgi:hypothetical protein